MRIFFFLTSNNPFVPPGREYLFAHGLHAGLIGDFVVSTHVLIPQIENSIRYILERQGTITSSLNSKGIQDQKNLNNLLYDPYQQELLKIFGEDIVFEFQGLLVEKFGSNLRNKMAHGLMNPAEFYSYSTIYLWWLILRICCLPILYQLNSAGDKTEPESDNEA